MRTTRQGAPFHGAVSRRAAPQTIRAGEDNRQCAPRRVLAAILCAANIEHMTKLLREAIRQVEQLPEAEQDAAAAAMLDYLAHRGDLHVSEEDLAEIRRRRADPTRRLVSHEDARGRIARLGS